MTKGKAAGAVLVGLQVGKADKIGLVHVPVYLPSQQPKLPRFPHRTAAVQQFSSRAVSIGLLTGRRSFTRDLT